MFIIHSSCCCCNLETAYELNLDSAEISSNNQGNVNIKDKFKYVAVFKVVILELQCFSLRAVHLNWHLSGLSVVIWVLRNEEKGGDVKIKLSRKYRCKREVKTK